jgi:pyruvate/2-oxoacid:ferredoxin oxidoreductase beta subunit
MLAHGVPYIATASVAYPDDLVRKFEKAKGIEGTRFIHLLSPCPPGWRIEAAKSIAVTRMATQSGVFPIYEIEDGEYRMNIVPAAMIPVEDYLRSQGRFDDMSGDMIQSVQKQVNERWRELLAKAEGNRE